VPHPSRLCDGWDVNRPPAAFRFLKPTKERHFDPERSRTGKRFFAAKHVISTGGGTFAAAVERSLYFIFALVLAPALRKPSWKLPPWQN